jgi:lysozyme
MNRLSTAILAGLVLGGGVAWRDGVTHLLASPGNRELSRGQTTPLSGDVTGANHSAFEFIEKWEGFSATAYRCPAGILTIGYGRTGNVSEGEQTTKEKEEIWLRKRVEDMKRQLECKLRITLTAGEKTAILSLAYNVGLSAIMKSSGWKYLNERRTAKCVSEWFSRERGFVRCGGGFSEGLARRRAAEQKLFEKGE